MRVVLARRLDGGSRFGGPPDVHAYYVPDSPDIGDHVLDREDGPLAWLAACGERSKPDEVETVEAFSGVPCMTCYMAAVLANDAPPVTRDQAESPPVREIAPPEPRVVDATPGGFSLSWREREIHLVAADAPRTELQGRPLVLANCGALGWEPQASRPNEWPMCHECIAIEAER